MRENHYITISSDIHLSLYIRIVIYSSFPLSKFISLHVIFISKAFSVSITYLSIKFSLLQLHKSTTIEFDDFSYRKNVNK